MDEIISIISALRAIRAENQNIKNENPDISLFPMISTLKCNL
jgi:hypothetical protein